MTRAGVLSDFAEDGPYKCLMEGLEAIAALIGTGFEEVEDERNYGMTATGKRFLTSLVR